MDFTVKYKTYMTLWKVKTIYNLFLEWKGKRSVSCQIIGLTRFLPPEMTQSFDVIKTQPLCFFPVLGEGTFHSTQFMNFKNHEPSFTFRRNTNVFLSESCFEHKCSSDRMGDREKTFQTVFVLSWLEASGPGRPGHMAGHRAGAEFTNHQLP